MNAVDRFHHALDGNTPMQIARVDLRGLRENMCCYAYSYPLGGRLAVRHLDIRKAIWRATNTTGFDQFHAKRIARDLIARTRLARITLTQQ